MEILTIFTPTYNRKHTIGRTYESLLRQTCHDLQWLIIDDGSTDGTQEWVQTLGSGRWVQGHAYDWMGRRTDNNGEYYVVDVPFSDGDGVLHVTYIPKPNGGLYTGYNVAYDFIQTELCVCIDSDDFAPDDMVEKVVRLWKVKRSEKFCGIMGLDFDLNTMQPIGGYFTEDFTEASYFDIHHRGDTKQVMRTDLMKQVAPQIGYEGEKNFNPIYMLINVMDRYPLLIINENLCIVEYQIGADSMSQGIFKQYINSPRSFAKMRLQEMNFAHNTFRGRFRSAIHYISSCIIARDKNWFVNSNRKILTISAVPFGIMLYLLIKWKTRN